MLIDELGADQECSRVLYPTSTARIHLYLRNRTILLPLLSDTAQNKRFPTRFSSRALLLSQRRRPRGRPRRPPPFYRNAANLSAVLQRKRGTSFGRFAPTATRSVPRQSPARAFRSGGAVALTGLKEQREGKKTSLKGGQNA